MESPTVSSKSKSRTNVQIFPDLLSAPVLLQCKKELLVANNASSMTFHSANSLKTIIIIPMNWTTEPFLQPTFFTPNCQFTHFSCKLASKIRTDHMREWACVCVVAQCLMSELTRFSLQSLLQFFAQVETFSTFTDAFLCQLAPPYNFSSICGYLCLSIAF